MREGLHKIVNAEETIVAISTPLGRSGLGVIRMSGRDALSIAQRFFKTSSSEIEPRHATLGRWTNDTDLVDEVVITYFQAPRSYTGEDVVEISAHGNPLILNRIVTSARDAGARIAEAGEFTFRAVLHGKMDLVQAEAVREFIDAQTEQQARIALRQINGSVSRRLQPIKSELVDMIAHLEAGIDFAEDDVHVPESVALIARLTPLIEDLERLQQTFNYGRLLIAGLQLAILGKPNVGKSSLFNRLVSADRAIVTDIPGTTRDVVSETVSVDGVPLRVSDTAGIRETTDRVESMGVARTLEALSVADVALVVIDGSAELDDNDRVILQKTAGLPHVIVINKSDLQEAVPADAFDGDLFVRVSAKTGAGLTELREAIRRFIASTETTLSDDSVLLNSRQNDAILATISALRAALAALDQRVPHEMVLLDLYESLGALGELTGEVVTDDILGRIFSTFCIGK